MNRIRELDQGELEQGEPVAEPSDQRILRMIPDGLFGPTVETVIRRRIEELAQAIRDKNLDRLMAFYASDVQVFDMRPPLLARGAGAYRQNFERWFNSFEGPLGFEFKDLRVVPGENTAFCHYLALVSGARSAGHISGYWTRGTTCFERRHGEWLVTHEHVSLPAKL